MPLTWQKVSRNGRKDERKDRKERATLFCHPVGNLLVNSRDFDMPLTWLKVSRSGRKGKAKHAFQS